VSFVKIGAISVIILACKIEFLPCFLIFWPFLMKFGIDALHVSSSISCEFRKNWYRNGVHYLRVYLKLCPSCDFSSHSFKIGVECLLLKPLSDWEFRIVWCCQKPSLLKDVNERPDFLCPVSVKFCGCPQKENCLVIVGLV
jgi:hypothetical protein